GRVSSPIDWKSRPSATGVEGAAGRSEGAAAERADLPRPALRPAGVSALVGVFVRCTVGSLSPGTRLDGHNSPSSISDAAFIIVNPSGPFRRPQGGRMPPRIVIVGGGAAGIGAAG